MSGEDLGLDYLLRIVERNGELVLVGTPRVNRSAGEVEIGSTQGMTNGFAKIILNPGWRFTRRTYQGKSLGHIYLTTDSSAPVASQSNTPPRSLPSSQPSFSSPPPAPSIPPERELIFTKPGDGSTAPSIGVPSAPVPPSPSTPERQIPVFVVPTN
jgi:N-acetylmuramoyl-L-alanine amidase